jgi:hypothetical protein
MGIEFSTAKLRLKTFGQEIVVNASVKKTP